MYFVKRMQMILAALLLAVLVAPAWSAGKGCARPDLLIETDELAKIINKPNVRVVDGIDPGTYSRAHIPGATNIFYQLLATLKTRKENGFPASLQDVPKIGKKKCTAVVSDPGKVITLADVKKRDKNTVLADTRSFKEFIGQDIVPGAARGGHIPGAVQLERSACGDKMDTCKAGGQV